MKRAKTALALGLIGATLAGCGIGPRHSAQECMERAMFFESHRSSREGMIAVGSVVMNRVRSDQFPNSVCAVVAQKNQFAPGVMTRKMQSKAMPDVREAARAVLRGERHPRIGNAMFFHAATHRFSYNNMHYVLTAGGNAFYEKRKPHLVTQPVPLPG
ncbi:MAG: cell wall hydrolase [Paracoccus sp. (in: a-proteobacteria)]|uniref:cell wall hydrolase n=1 Tax=Paracoccus sp. TaxID=267 RepID=UPI0026E08BEA|nr:cell wall hydrolase [Paracoccus sp. (in: a-proteobacteria)]MDO5620255.1 cell wall hydrolase [Paracoccus sp. (in: a-proteobacteria)]